jgi:hypothetical protein
MILCSTCGEGVKENAKFCGACGSRAQLATTAATPGTWPNRQGASAAQAPLRAVGPAPARETAPFAQAAAPSLSDVYSKLRLGAVNEAAGQLSRWWGALRWEIRLTIVATALALTMLLFISVSGVELNTPGGFVMSLILLPIVLGALVALARPDPVPGWMARFTGWSARKRDRARDKGTFLANWFFRPFYALLCASNSVTAPIKEPYLRAGSTQALQFFALYLALLVAYAAIMVVIAITVIVIVLWIFSLILSEGFSSGSSSRAFSHVSSRRSRDDQDSDYAQSRNRSGYTKPATGIFGNKYQQHHNKDGTNAGYSEQQKGIFGNQYTQHYSGDGSKTGYSESQKGIFGNKYTQHHDQDATNAGYSERQKGIFGNEYVQHYDQQGKKTGRSEVRKDIFGNEYVKHENE